jgi:hypothetical protein
MVDVAVDVADAIVLVVALAHVRGSNCVGSMVTARAQFLYETCVRYGKY